MPPIPAIFIPALLSELLGHRTLAQCAIASGFVILPKGGTFGARAYRPADEGQVRNYNEVRTAARNTVRNAMARATKGGDEATFLAWCLDHPEATVTDPVHDHARALLSAFGGHFPDWLAPEVTALERALSAAEIKGNAA